MRIINLRTEKNGDRSRVAAMVTWEDCDRPGANIYFETEDEFSQGLSCNPHAFIAGCVLPAMHHGEKRVAIDAEICPELRDNLITAMSLVRHWFYRADHNLLSIEAKTRTGLPSPRTPDRAGFFFSGGIDCLATFRANRLNYPPEHPGSIKDGFLIYGQNIESDNRPETFATARAELSEVARTSGFELIPVYTNIRLLDEDVKVFDVNHGAILGAVAHAFSRRITRMFVAASDSIPGLDFVNSHSFKPYGSHPLLDPCYSSSDLRILHDGIRMSRLDKTRFIAGWDMALGKIKVCGPNWPGRNCGRCEKCVRTMLELLAAGVLDKSEAFPLDDLSGEQVERINIQKTKCSYSSDDYGVNDDYLELIPPLREKGRLDLVKAIERVLKRSRRPSRHFLSSLREFDVKYLHGVLASTKKSLQFRRV